VNAATAPVSLVPQKPMATSTGWTGVIPSGIALALVLLHGWLAWEGRSPGVLTGQDDAEYFMLAQALRHGGYADLHRIGTPTHQKFPPGYPAAIAAVTGVVGPRFDAVLLLGVLGSALALALLYTVLRRLWHPVGALMVLAPLAVNPYLLGLAGEIRAEPLYLLLTLVALFALATADPRPGRLVVATTATVAAALTRSIGVTLLVAVAFHWLLERRWGAVAAVSLSAALTVGVWIAWTIKAPEQFVGSSYIADVTDRIGSQGGGGVVLGLLQRVVRNLPKLLGSIVPAQLAFPAVPRTPWDNLASATLVTAGLAAGLWALARSWRPAALYVLATGGLLSIWPWIEERFVTPSVPLILAVTLLGLDRLVARWGMRARAVVVGTVALILTVNGTHLTLRAMQTRADCMRGATPPSPTCMRADQASYLAAMQHIRQHVPAGAVFMSAKPETVYHYTGHQSVFRRFTYQQDSLSLPAFLQQWDVRYILLGSVHIAEPGTMAAALLGNCRRLELEAMFPPRTLLLRVPSAGEEPPAHNGCAAIDFYRRANLGRDFDLDR